MRRVGIKGERSQRRALEIKFVEMAPALCDNKIDAFVFVAGHPNAVFQEAADLVQTRLIAPVDGAAIDTLRRSQAVLREGRGSRGGCTRAPRPRSRPSA